MWIRAYEIEDDFGTVESAEALLRQAVTTCATSEKLWLLLIQVKYLKEKDSEGARKVLEDAMSANKLNQEFISSERIWLTAYQVMFPCLVHRRSSGKPTKRLVRARF